MAKIDNEKMWASMLNYEPTTEEKKRIGKALMSDRNFPFGMVKDILIRGALREQGLMEKGGEIVDYAPQYKVDDLRQTVEALQRQIDHMDGKDMPPRQ